MKPEKVLNILNQKGVKITNRTLQRYAKIGLISTPIRENKGRGKGKSVDYPEYIVCEIYASYKLQNDDKFKLHQDEIAKIRAMALESLEKYKDEYLPVLQKKYNDEIPKILTEIDWTIGAVVKEHSSTEEERYFYFILVKKWLHAYSEFQEWMENIKKTELTG